MRRRRGSAIRGDKGATAAEYALILGLIAVVVITAVVFLGTSVTGLFDAAASEVSNLP